MSKPAVKDRKIVKAGLRNRKYAYQFINAFSRIIQGDALKIFVVFSTTKRLGFDGMLIINNTNLLPSSNI
jgi:hypothetical protein